MKRKKLLKTLTEFLDGEGRKKRRHQAELRELLNKLKEKDTQLQEKMRTEKNKQKQERFGKELEIIRAQHAKGMETLRNLETP